MILCTLYKLWIEKKNIHTDRKRLTIAKRNANLIHFGVEVVSKQVKSLKKLQKCHAFFYFSRSVLPKKLLSLLDYTNSRVLNINNLSINHGRFNNHTHILPDSNLLTQNVPTLL